MAIYPAQQDKEQKEGVKILKQKRADSKIIGQIVARAKRQDRFKFDSLSLIMDLEAVHEANPLRLKALLEADTFNFWHDIAGIINYINRGAGEGESIFTDFFSPRFTL